MWVRHGAYLLFGKVLGILLAEKLYFKRWFLRNLESSDVHFRPEVVPTPISSGAPSFRHTQTKSQMLSGSPQPRPGALDVEIGR